MIVENNSVVDVLTIDLDGQGAMPIFSFREEAEMFVWFEAWDRLQVREITAEGLISLLFGPYSYLEEVVLDPLPENCDEGMNRLVSVSRRDFA